MKRWFGTRKRRSSFGRACVDFGGKQKIALFLLFSLLLLYIYFTAHIELVEKQARVLEIDRSWQLSLVNRASAAKVSVFNRLSTQRCRHKYWPVNDGAKLS